jgi:hypothetical protein
MAMEGHLATLERLEARQADQEADDLEALRQAWAPALTQAKAILEELSGLQAAYTPTVEALTRRDFSGLPPVARVLNTIAGIERSCLELQHHFTHTAEDLQRIVTAVEQLNERSAPLLHANASTYRELLGFYTHSPQGVRELFQRLQHLVASLAAGIRGAQASPKGLRHGFGVATVQARIPLNLVQRWLGHAQLSTTAIYAEAIGPEEQEIAARMWT